MAATSRFLSISRAIDLSVKQFQPPQPPPPFFSRHILIRPSLPSVPSRRSSSTAISCLVSGVDGGGVSDEFVSTRKLGFDREFSVIANMLKRIEPLDTSVISKGVSNAAKESMKQTISTMLGLLPSDQFSVTVRVSKRPLDRLLASSIVTGYTLWNAEYRISLMRNFDLTADSRDMLGSIGGGDGFSEVKAKESEGENEVNGCAEYLENLNLQNSLGELAPEVLDYIQQLESELGTAKKELGASKQENTQLENVGGSNNDLLEYLRSLESDMVIELSRPSSLEVEDVIHELVQNIMATFFKDDSGADVLGNLSTSSKEDLRSCDEENGSTIGTSRDYLAKLLFWCMLLGHHLRGLENRLHLSCAVGLL